MIRLTKFLVDTTKKRFCTTEDGFFYYISVELSKYFSLLNQILFDFLFFQPIVIILFLFCSLHCVASFWIWKKNVFIGKKRQKNSQKTQHF